MTMKDFWQGYGIDPPALGVVSLKEEISSCVPFTGVGSGDLLSQSWNNMNGLLMVTVDRPSR